MNTPTAPAGWVPDPSGLWELRYWDDATWTEHVATGHFTSQEPFQVAPQQPSDPNQVLCSIEGVSTREPARLDLTWSTLNFVPLRRLHETRNLPLFFVARLGADGPEDGQGKLHLTVRGQGYVGPSTFVFTKVAHAHWFRALVLRQRAIVTGWPPTVSF